MRNRKSNPEGVSPRDLTSCWHKPECIVTTNPSRSVLITIITWHFQFRPMNVSILHLKDDYRARSESRFACYAHCYVTWCPLTTGIVASQWPSARDAVLVTRYPTPFTSACLNSFLYARLKNGRIMLWQCPSVCPSVRPSVRPSFPDFFLTCFEISIWNLVYAFSRWHDMSSLSFITIGSLWPSLQPKVGQTQFLQSWPYKSR